MEAPRPPALNAKGKQLVFNNSVRQHPITKGTHIANGKIRKPSGNKGIEPQPFVAKKVPNPRKIKAIL